ncbi:MAG TPA: cytochrome P450 [Ramlibacter sp.]|nr:cytochrome P450 [Ramlibacter sp.]
MPVPSDLPSDPVAAATHADPYPYYARLRRERPFHYDAALSMWIAASGQVVAEAFAHPDLRVRPPAEPVPRALAGTPAGEVFARLVRMTDGDFHAQHKPVVQASTARFTMAGVAKAASQAALDLVPRVDANALLSAIPVQTMARVLGVPEDLLDDTTRWVEQFVQGIGPQPSPTAIEKASIAAQHLMAQGEAQGLDKVRAANRIAMMQQSLDATAGLIGNTIRYVRQQPAVIAGAESWRPVTAEVARWDSPVQNTRRYAAADVTLGGKKVAQGDAILLLLASANRDPSLNADPDRFDASRTDRRILSFGAGRHQCPGDAIAIEIAAAAVQSLHDGGYLQKLFNTSTGFRQLPNARIPVFS